MLGWYTYPFLHFGFAVCMVVHVCMCTVCMCDFALCVVVHVYMYNLHVILWKPKAVIRNVLQSLHYIY